RRAARRSGEPAHRRGRLGAGTVGLARGGARLRLHLPRARARSRPHGGPSRVGDEGTGITMSAGGGTRAVVAALAANLGIAVTKFVAFALTASSSMLAEAIHSVADSGNQVLLLVGGRRSTREATARHPFGYGRERYIYAFIVSVVIFFVGGVFAAYEAWHKLGDPHPIESWQWVPVLVLVVAIGLEAFSFRTAI